MEGCCCMVPVIVNDALTTDEFYETRRRLVYVLLLGYSGRWVRPTAVPIPGKPFVS